MLDFSRFHSASICSILLLSLPLLVVSLGGLQLPAAPSARQIAQLARSPASSALAADFFAREFRPLTSGNFTPAASASGPIELEPSEPSLTLGHSFQLNRYHSLDELYAFIDELGARYSNVHVFTIGLSSEGRPIKALELINNSTDADFVWLDALTHAREWITGASLAYIVDQLVASGGHRKQATRRIQTPVSTKNFIIVPVVNPDGYEFTWTTNRMWRKNRSVSAHSKCIGADLNRNFELSFGGEGASKEPCSHIYAGQSPFSEPETRALAELLWSLKDRVKFYLTMHSFNQLWACPYAYTTQPSVHLNEHMRVLSHIQQAVKATTGLHYEIGPLSTSLYVGSGFGIDFAYERCKIKHSYLVELRDRGQFGFQLPAEQILATGRETLAGLRAGLKAVFGQA